MSYNILIRWVLSLTAISLAVVLTIYVKEKKIEAPTIVSRLFILNSDTCI